MTLQVKQSLLATGVFQDNVVTHLVAGLGAGFIAVCVGSPVDVVKSRVMGAREGARLLSAAGAGREIGSNAACMLTGMVELGRTVCMDPGFLALKCVAVCTGDKTGRFAGVLDCFVKTAREEGITAFYKGGFHGVHVILLCLATGSSSTYLHASSALCQALSPTLGG
jgi:hypothetical protein